MKKAITTSIFDIFKIGPGPSSSHTIGPMKAAYDFLAKLRKLPEATVASANKLTICLYGSLSSTGKGHGTDRAVAAGLLGNTPEECDSRLLSEIFTSPDAKYEVNINGHIIAFGENDICFDDSSHDFPFQNTLILQLLNNNDLVFEKTYYSVGGGFIHCEGEFEAKRQMPPYRYRNMIKLIDLTRKYDLSLPQILMENEKAVSCLDEHQINQRLDNLINVMEDAVKRGLESAGLLPGPIGLHRKAGKFHQRAQNMEHIHERFIALLDAFSLAASEENAAGHKVVTAPTSGSSGIIPGIIYFLKHHHHVSEHKLREGLMVAAAVGFIARHNASIAGSEVGCQGEVGVASAMAAAMLAHVNDYPVDTVECAAEIALEHHLGLTCDPVEGYVQIPCIERNAVGAVTAYNAYLLAAIGDPKYQKVSLDECIEAMLETGRDMSNNYKETSKGGLAVCSLCC